VSGYSKNQEQSGFAPCCVCGGSTSETAVWAFPMCYRCAADWSQVAPTYGELAAAGIPDSSETNRAFYRSRLEAWVEQRAGRAA
jgi:hypothetical protein